MAEGIAAAEAAASGNGNRYEYYRTIIPLETLLAEIQNYNGTSPYTLQLTSDVSGLEKLDDNYLFAAIEINNGEIIRTDVYDKIEFKKFVNQHHPLSASASSTAPSPAAPSTAPSPAAVTEVSREESLAAGVPFINPIHAATTGTLVTPNQADTGAAAAATGGPVAFAAADDIGAAHATANSSNPNNEYKYFEKRVQELLNIAGDVNLQFGIGKYATAYGDGWRKATANDWMTPQFQAALIFAHNKGNGWAILDDLLECNNSLYVDEGEVKINDYYVVEVGFNGSQKLSHVYPAMNLDKNKPWTEMPPEVNDIWFVDAKNITDTIRNNPPCLFVKVPIQNNPLEEQSLEDSAAVPSEAAAAAAIPLEASTAAAAPRRIPKRVVNPDESTKDVNFAIGYHGTLYPGWVMMQQGLLNINKQNILDNYWKNETEGFLLLEKQINCNNILHVADGRLYINDKTITHLDHHITKTHPIKSKYSAVSNTNLWNKHYPTANDNWTVRKVVGNYDITGTPCLFMRIPK